MPDTKFDANTAIYTPAQVSTYGIQHVETMRASKDRHAVLPIAGIRDYFAPMVAGEVCAVIAQSSHYKTGFMDAWEYGIANQLMQQGREDEVIVHVSVEEYIEHQSFMEFAKESNEDAGDLARGEVQDWGRLMEAAVKVGTIPIFRIGASLARAEDMPSLYMTNMIRAIKHLQRGMFDKPLKIAACFFDYLQAFPFDPEIKQMGAGEHQRRLQVRNDVYTLRQAGGLFNCPIIVGVQAKQKLEGAPSAAFQLPGMYDGEESSSIAQRVERIITLWMPKQTSPLGSAITHGDVSFKVEENILFVKVAKQRGRLPAGRIWKCRIDFQKNIIAPEANE